MTFTVEQIKDYIRDRYTPEEALERCELTLEEVLEIIDDYGKIDIFEEEMEE